MALYQTLRRRIGLRTRLKKLKRGLKSPFRRASQSPRGSLDQPSAEMELPRGLVSFRGWAVFGKRTPDAVELVLNQAVRLQADIRVPRPDVPINLSDLSIPGDCGWAASADLFSFPEGDLRVRIIARWGKRTHTIADRLFALRGAGIAGYLDSPRNGDTQKGNLLLGWGWAYMGRKIARIDVMLDGECLGPARTGLVRDDVPETYGPLTGFEFRFVIKDHKPGVRQLLVRATDFDGMQAEIGSAQIQFARNDLTDDEADYAQLLRTRNVRALDGVPIPTHEPGRRLLVFTHSLSLGGGQLYLQELLRQIVPKLDRCVVVSPTPGILGAELEALGADLIVSGRGIPLDLQTHEGYVRELQHFIRNSGCNAILLNTVGMFPAADAAQRAELPTIWAIHESFELEDWIHLNASGRDVSPYILERITASLTNATRLVFESDATREMYDTACDGQARTVTIPYGIDIASLRDFEASYDRESFRSSQHIPANCTVILCAAIFEQRKSQGALIDAFKRVYEAHPDALLVLVGDHPCSYSDALHHAVDGTEAAQHIRFVPITTELWNWYGAADLLVSASDVESLPRSMLEAMALGKPILAVSVFGVPELILDGENGWLATPRDLGSLVAGLERALAESPERRRELGENGRALVYSDYDSRGYGSTYLKLIDEITAAVPSSFGGSASATTSAVSTIAGE